MSPEKTFLQEIAQDPIAIQQSRSEPIQQAPQQKSMDFLKSLVLGVPQQVLQDRPVKESIDLERTLELQLEAEAKRLAAPQDPKDQVTFDIPLLVRVFELVREGIKSDVELHQLVERLIALRDKGTLTMADYDAIAGGNPNGTSRENDPITTSPIVGDKQDESLDLLNHLAGLR